MAVVVLMIEHLGEVFWSTHHSHATAWSLIISSWRVRGNASVIRGDVWGARTQALLSILGS